MVFSDVYGAKRGYVRRMVEDAPEVDAAVTRVYDVSELDAVLIIPSADTGSMAVAVQVSYQEPVYADGALDETELDFHDFASVNVASTDNPDDKKIKITPYDDGVTAVRVGITGTSLDGNVYVRGYYVQR